MFHLYLYHPVYLLNTPKRESALSLPHLLERSSLRCPTGRYPNTRNLGLEEVGVEMDKAGNIKVGEA